MSYLFQITEKIVFPNPETLLISPFSDIWERDKTKEKHIALRELTYVEFMVSQQKSNPYKDYPDQKRHEILCEQIMKDVNWKPDTLVNQAISRIHEYQTDASATYSYYIAAKTAADKMKNFFTNVDVNERNEKNGNPIFKPRDITSALNDTERVLTNLNNLKKKVEEELYEDSKLRADKQISPFADPNSLK